MIYMRLQRLAMRPDVTLGVLSLGNTPYFFTVERPWLNNQHSISCIPQGNYPVEWVDTNTAGNRNGRGIGVLDVPSRDLIRIHVANRPTDVEGCIGIGMKRYDFPGVKGVGASAEALRNLMAMFPDGSKGTIHILNP